MKTLKRLARILLAVWLTLLTANSLVPSLFSDTASAATNLVAWATTGNALASGNFLGSTNSFPLIFKTNNTERMRITPNGNVGIGTPNPKAPLHVWRNGSGNFPIAIEPGGWGVIGFNSYWGGSGRVYSVNGYAGSISLSSNDGSFHFQTARSGSQGNITGENDRMVITNSGKVGIGTTSPGALLHVLSNNSGWGVWGSSPGNIGVLGDSTDNIGVYGLSRNSIGVTGLSGRYGVWGQTGSHGIAIYGNNPDSVNTPDGFAGYFDGDVRVTGTCYDCDAVTRMDDPTNASNSLYHTGVNSSEMKNLYDGVAQLDAHGKAMVRLPDWFSAINKDFRYQLTALGAAMPKLHIERELKDNQFKIAGGKPNAKVSWQVTGIRNDKYAQDHPFQVQVEKSKEKHSFAAKPEEVHIPELPPAEDK